MVRSSYVPCGIIVPRLSSSPLSRFQANDTHIRLRLANRRRDRRLSCCRPWYVVYIQANIRPRHNKHMSRLAGGTNLRVCLVTLQGHGRFEITQTKYRLTEEQKQEDGGKLFDFCAECIRSFVETNTEKEGQSIQSKTLDSLFDFLLDQSTLFTISPSFRIS